MKYVYHGSPVEGLTYIDPQISTHGKNWVYATKDKGIALTFMQKWNDYLLSQSVDEHGHQTLTERLPNILEEIYKGKKGYIYYLNSSNFLEGQTSFSPEVVSEEREPVLHCDVIEDCYHKLCEMDKCNEITLFRYPNRPHYIPSDDSDLVESTKYSLKNARDKTGLVNYAIEKYPKLKDALLALLENV